CGIKRTACICDGSDMLLSSLLTCRPVKCMASFGTATSIMHRGFEQVHYILVWMVVRAAEGAGLENQRAATPSRGLKSTTIRHTRPGIVEIPGFSLCLQGFSR